MKKLTKMELFAQIATVIASASDVENKQELLDFIAHEQSLLTAKAEKAKSAPSKPSKSVEENNILREAILAYLAQQDELKSITDMLEEIPELSGASNPKVAQLLSPLYKAEKIKKQKVGKVMCYELA